MEKMKRNTTFRNIKITLWFKKWIQKKFYPSYVMLKITKKDSKPLGVTNRQKRYHKCSIIKAGLQKPKKLTIENHKIINTTKSNSFNFFFFKRGTQKFEKKINNASSLSFVFFRVLRISRHIQSSVRSNHIQWFFFWSVFMQKVHYIFFWFMSLFRSFSMPFSEYSLWKGKEERKKPNLNFSTPHPITDIKIFTSVFFANIRLKKNGCQNDHLRDVNGKSTILDLS